MNDKLLSSLSMARGAGKLKIGFDASKEAVADGASLVILTSDASDRTRAAVNGFCQGKCPVAEIGETQEDISSKFGRRFAVAAVTDPNFAALIRKNLDTLQEERAW